ncbi:MAG: tRNA (guanosine(46)-N7)-methyltransferase TrmB [Pirellulales bacterium]|nr:tRNA (guanosine(46)-N7)-methyltransferase TrmB [Pirellulales bacterium]
MGRRALRKIDPNLDLARHLKTFDQLPDPWDLEALFGRVAPLEVEVGCGKGLFMQSATASRPEHVFLGIEVARKYARFCAARLAKNNLENGMIVHGDALCIFHALLPNQSVASVHIYFPDPWWKKRHRKRRVMTGPFVQDVERILTVGGRLHFWTDVRDYFDETLDLLASHTNLTGPLEVPEVPAEHPLDYRTHFERRMRLAGEPVYRVEFEK